MSVAPGPSNLADTTSTQFSLRLEALCILFIHPSYISVARHEICVYDASAIELLSQPSVLALISRRAMSKVGWATGMGWCAVSLFVGLLSDAVATFGRAAVS